MILFCLNVILLNTEISILYALFLLYFTLSADACWTSGGAGPTDGREVVQIIEDKNEIDHAVFCSNPQNRRTF